MSKDHVTRFLRVQAKDKETTLVQLQQTNQGQRLNPGCKLSGRLNELQHSPVCSCSKVHKFSLNIWNVNHKLTITILRLPGTLFS